MKIVRADHGRHKNSSRQIVSAKNAGYRLTNVATVTSILLILARADTFRVDVSDCVKKRPAYLYLIHSRFKRNGECLTQTVQLNRPLVDRIVTWTWVVSLLYTGALMLSPKPKYAEALLSTWSHADLASHFSIFVCLRLVPNVTQWGRQNSLLCTIGLVGFGIVLECSQSLTSYRSVSMADAFANAAGVLLGCALSHLLRRSSGSGAI